MTTPTLTQAQAQEAVELLKRLANTPPDYEPGELAPYCHFCGKNQWLKHMDNCPVKDAQALLAAIESEASE